MMCQRGPIGLTPWQRPLRCWPMQLTGPLFSTAVEALLVTSTLWPGRWAPFLHFQVLKLLRPLWLLLPLAQAWLGADASAPYRQWLECRMSREFVEHQRVRLGQRQQPGPSGRTLRADFWA